MLNRMGCKEAVMEGTGRRMKRSISFFVISMVLVTAFAAALNIMIRYNLNWMDYIRYSIPLRAEEEAYLNDTDIVCGVNYNDLPLSFVNDDGEADGILIDFLSQLSVEIENNIDVCLNEEDRLEVELREPQMQAAIVAKTNTSEQQYLFTEPLYIMHGKILVREDSPFKKVNQIANIKVAVESGDTDTADRLMELYGGKGVSIIYADDFDDALYKLKNGQAAAVAGDETRISYYLNQKRTGQDYRFLKYSFSRKEVCIAIEKSQEKLLDVFNKGILSMKKKNLVTKTQSKWFGMLRPETVDMQEVDLIYKVALLFVLCGLAFTVWNLSTAKKVTEKTKELRHSKEQLRLIIDTLDRGLAIVQEDGRIVEVNQGFCRIIGVGKAQLLGTDIGSSNVLHPFLMREDEKVFRLKEHYYTKQTIDLEDEQKKLYIIEDCTRRYINEIRNIQEEKMIAVGQLSAGLAHEIRNPLGLIRSYMYLIKKFCRGEDGTHAVAVIHDSIDRINRLIESLLKFSKLSSDERRQVDLDELIGNILLLEKKRMEGKEISAEYVWEGNGDSLVWVNEDLMKITIINLLNNSIDALEQVDGQRKIDIRAKAAQDVVYIKFQDNGCGVDQEKLLEIFNPFYSSKEQGTGLGLYIVSSQLEQVGGSIRAESTLGEGMTFYIEVPMRRTAYEQ